MAFWGNVLAIEARNRLNTIQGNQAHAGEQTQLAASLNSMPHFFDALQKGNVQNAAALFFISKTGPLSADEQNKVREYANWFDHNTPPHQHDPEIYMASVQLVNFCERAWPGGLPNAAARMSYAQAKARLGQEAQALDNGRQRPQGNRTSFQCKLHSACEHKAWVHRAK